MTAPLGTATAADQLAYVWKRPLPDQPLTTEALRDFLHDQWPDLHKAIEAVVNSRTDTKEGAA